MERLGGTQFNIDVTNVREKARKKVAPASGCQSVLPALGRMTGRCDQRCGQSRNLFFYFVLNGIKMVESQLKEIRRIGHGDRQRQVIESRNNADDLAARLGWLFDRIVSCHILFTPLLLGG